MENSEILSKLCFCCKSCYEACKDCDSPIFVSSRNLNIELSQRNYSVCYTFSVCPWCGFKYFNLEKVWERDLLEAYNIDYDALKKTDEWIEIPEEFDSDEWWIKREYFDLTKGYGGEKSNSLYKIKDHDHFYCCDPMYNLLGKEGHDSFRSYIKFVPNVRAYVILSKKKGGGFESMDYCPFCGAKFPERLDEELSKILQTEYGLKSWKDYKKAPTEFHSDKWWKKRGL